MKNLYRKLEKYWEYGPGRMALAAFCAHSVSISIGICQGYSAIWIPQLLHSDEFSINSEETSWLASLGAVTNPIGSILSGVLAEYLGRRRSIQISSLPFIVGWICIAVGRDINALYIGRLITGIAAGMSTASYTYVSEISTPSNRGFLQALGPICASFGILLTYTLGYILNWSTVALLSLIFAFFSIVTMQFLPESPPYLMKKSDDSALDAFLFFKRNIGLAQEEMANVNANNQVDMKNKSLRELCMSPETIKPFCILVVLFLLQELSGIYTILFYAVTFFGETDIQMNDYISSIIVGCIRFGMSIVAAFLINKIGRKVLCIFSSFGMSVSILAIALYVKYYEIYPHEAKVLAYLPLFCIIFNVLFSMIGMLPIPWILCGELFPLRVRPVMSGIVICMAQSFIFICVKIYNNMVDYLNFSGTLFTFFVASVLAMLFCKYVLPETKDKSLNEIEEYFRNKSSDKELAGVDNKAFSSSPEVLVGSKSSEGAVFKIKIDS